MDSRAARLRAASGTGIELRAGVTPGDGFIEVTGEIEDRTGRDRAVWLGFTVPVDAGGWRWGESLDSGPVIAPGAPAYPDEKANLIPVSVAWGPSGGVAVCIPPTNPCVFEVSADERGVGIRMAFGLSRATRKFPSRARFALRVFSVDGESGLRDALAKYYDWFPEHYSIEPWVMKALDHHHDWFGGEVDVDTLVDPDSKWHMAYTKTSGRIQGLKDVESMTTQERVMAALGATRSIHHFCKKAPAGVPELELGRRTIVNSVCHTPRAEFATILKPKYGEIDFPINCDPDLFEDTEAPVFGRVFMRKVREIHERGNFESVHWDRLGGWGNSLNYRREHFAYVDHPLTFNQDGRVCIHTKLTHYELFDALRRWGRGRRMFQEGAGLKTYGWNKRSNRPAGHGKDGRFFTAALLAGGWHEGSFKPIPLGGMDFERIAVGRKSYRIASGNIVKQRKPLDIEDVKRALAQTTAYGFACPVQVQYFHAPGRPHFNEAYSRYHRPPHRELWRRYEPVNLAVRLAGWEPVTHARAGSGAVQLQRFGRIRDGAVYLTVWGPEPPESTTITVDGDALGLGEGAKFTEIVSGALLRVTRTPGGWRLELPLERNMTRVIKATVSTAKDAKYAK